MSSATPCVRPLEPVGHAGQGGPSKGFECTAAAVASLTAGRVQLHMIPLDPDTPPREWDLPQPATCCSVVDGPEGSAALALFVGSTSVLKALVPKTSPSNIAEGGDATDFSVVASLTETPNFLVPAQSGALLFIGLGPSVVVVDTITPRTIARLEGHHGDVTHACLLDAEKGRLATGGRDRTVKVWDLEAGRVFWQSGVEAAYPVSAMACCEEGKLLAVAFEDGKLILYDVLAEGCRMRHSLALERVMPRLMKNVEEMAKSEKNDVKIISSEPLWRLGYDLPSTAVDEPAVVEENEPYRCLHLAWSPEQDGGWRQLCIVSDNHSVILDANTLNLSQLVLYNSANSEQLENDHCAFDGQYISSAHAFFEGDVLNLVGSNAFSDTLYQGAALLPQVSMLLQDDSQGQGEKSIGVSSIDLSLECKPEALDSRNILLSQYQKYDAKQEAEKKKKAGDKPVTFHSKVKSSGYGAKPPVMKMFAGSKPSRGKVKALPPGAKYAGKRYPADSPPCCSRQTLDSEGGRSATCSHNGPVWSCSFSPDGEVFCSASADRSVAVCKTPLRKNLTSMSAMQGHNQTVTDASFALEKHWCISSSADRTARIWLPPKSESLMILDRPEHSSKQAFGHPVVSAQFAYRDRFIALACGPEAMLFKFRLPPSNSMDDIERLRKECKYKCVSSISTDAKSVTFLAALNSTYSPFALAAYSNRSVVVIDWAAQQVVATMLDCHAKPVHYIALQNPSAFTDSPSSQLNSFLTAAIDGCIKMWDARQQKAVLRMQGHINRSQPIRCDVSPCGRFVATGSEDKSAYLYDIRTGQRLHSMQGATDTTTCCKFNPVFPQLAVGSLDGQIRLYADK